MHRPEDPPIEIAPDHPFHPIVADAYRVFATAKPDHTGVCVRCCMDPEIEADFFAPHIRSLPAAYVRDWYSGAYQKWGVPRSSWSYLLPRILELLAMNEIVDNVGLEVVLHRFETGNPDHWSAAQWKVLERFRHAYLERALTDFEHCPALDDAICMFGVAGWPLDALLDQVASADDAVLARRLYHDWCPLGPHRGKVWITAFWEGPLNARIYEFYTSDELYRRMETLALSDEAGQEAAAMASGVAGVIEAARA